MGSLARLHSDQRQERESPEWPVLSGGLVEWRDRVLSRDARRCDGQVVTASAPQAGGIPGVFNLSEGSRYEREATVRGAVWPQARCASLYRHDSDLEPFRVHTSTGLRPPA